MVEARQFSELRSLEQNDLLQAACGDLSEQIQWYGNKLTKDEWRHLICAFILQTKVVPGIGGGVVTLGGSSRRLNKEQGSEAITLAFSLGDAPWEYEPTQTKQVRWCEAVVKARWLE